MFSTDRSIFDSIKSSISNMFSTDRSIFDSNMFSTDRSIFDSIKSSISNMFSTDDTKLSMINNMRSKQIDNNILSKNITSAQTGGMIKGSGLVNVHAGEVIGPLKEVRDIIQTETFNEFEEYVSNKPKKYNTYDKEINVIPKIDVTIIDRINKEIYDKKNAKEQEKNDFQKESFKEQIKILDQNRLSLVNGISSINNNNKVINTKSDNDNSNNIVNNQRTIMPPERVPSNIENMGVVLVNSNWL